MTFPLTDARLLATIEGVRAMPDPSRPAPDLTVLIERARRRDAAAFRDLFRAHLSAVHRVVYRIHGPGPDVEDLVQTTFVEAFRSLPDFRGDALFSTWLTRIAVRVTLRASRRRPPRALPLEAALEPADGGAGPERLAAAREGLLIIDGLLDELRPKQRVAFVLHVLEGYSIDEVGAIVNASISAVKVRIHDARRRMEKSLKRRPGALAALVTGGGNA
jgi:RNA polymerase sigma-70 factor (ECF subfamily)